VDFGTDAWRSAHAHREPPRSDSGAAVGEGRRTPRRRVRVVEDRGGRDHMRSGPGDGGRALGGRLPPACLEEQPVRTPQPPALAAVTGDRGAARLDRSAGRRRRRPVDRWTGPRPRDGVCGDWRSDEGPTDREQDAGPPLEPRRRASGADAPCWGRQHAGEKRAASKAPAGRSSSHAPVRLLAGPSHSPLAGGKEQGPCRCRRGLEAPTDEVDSGLGELLPPSSADVARGVGRKLRHRPRFARGVPGPMRCAEDGASTRLHGALRTVSCPRAVASKANGDASDA
jgi:hypothetical protein